jgi:hypothetical protein
MREDVDRVKGYAPRADSGMVATCRCNTGFCLLGRRGGRMIRLRIGLDDRVASFPMNGGKRAGPMRLRELESDPIGDGLEASVRPWGDEGVFKVEVATGEKTLLVSFRQLADALRADHPDVDQKELFINHTLWSRNDERIFFVRGDFDRPSGRLDVPLTMGADGSDLRPLTEHPGGHVEWESDRRLIGARGGSQVLYDVVAQRVTGLFGGPDVFPKPGGDIALSPDGAWFVNGHGAGGKNYSTILRRGDGAWTRTAGLDQGGLHRGRAAH